MIHSFQSGDWVILSGLVARRPADEGLAPPPSVRTPPPCTCSRRERGKGGGWGENRGPHGPAAGGSSPPRLRPPSRRLRKESTAPMPMRSAVPALISEPG